jgi:hypothetical protein
MNKKVLTYTSLLIALAIFTVSCGSNVEPTPTVDANAIMTEVAMTVAAEVTEAALLTPSATLPPAVTDTPMPMISTQALTPDAGLQTTPTVPVVTAGPTAAVITGDDAGEVEDVTVPDGEIFYENESFKKAWKIKNTGTTTWDASYSIVNIDGNTWGEDVIVPITESVPPGSDLTISVQLRAPSGLGFYMSRWKMMNPNGVIFGQEMYVYIQVGTFEDKTPTAEG